MARNLLLLATLFTTQLAAHAELSDVTSQYIGNASFETCPAVEAGSDGIVVLSSTWNTWDQHSAYDYEEQGWKLTETDKTNCNGGVIAYGVEKFKYGGKWSAYVPGPAASPTGDTTGKTLVFVGNTSVAYQQPSPVTLTAGTYYLTINVYAYNGATTNPEPTLKLGDKNVVGFIAEDGTEYKSDKLFFKSNEWDTDVIKIELFEDTRGVFQLSYGSSYYVAIDDIRLEYDGSIITTELKTAITRATALSAELGGTDAALKTAIETATAYEADPESAAGVHAQAEALYAAMSAALQATTAAVNLSTVYMENPSFEAGDKKPWDTTGSISTPDITMYNIDGEVAMDFKNLPSEYYVRQTVSHLPQGYYMVDALLRYTAKLTFGTETTACTGSSYNNWFHRVHSAAFQSDGGTLTVGAEGDRNTNIDCIRLFYATDAASLLKAFYEQVKKDGRYFLDHPDFAPVTGSERTDLEARLEAIATDGTDQDMAVIRFKTAVGTFVNSVEKYNKFETEKRNAAVYTRKAYPYGSAELLQNIVDVVNTVATSADNAQALADNLKSLCFQFYVSNAYTEGVNNRKDYTEKIAGANAEGTRMNSAWRQANMTIRTSSDTNIKRNAWTNPKTGKADGTFYGVTYDYYRSGAEQTAYMLQSVSGLPKGTYVLSITYLGAVGNTVDVKVDNRVVGQMEGVGLASGGKYEAGWIECVFEFKKDTDADTPMEIGVESLYTSNYKDWCFDNVRLYCINDGSSITGISENACAGTTGAVCYNLGGQRVAQPAKGLYIVGGKKVVKK